MRGGGTQGPGPGDDRSGAGGRPSEGTHPGHPKHQLYDQIYDPLVVAWFAELALAEASEIKSIMGRATTGSLLATLEELDTLFHAAVDRTMAGLDAATVDRIVAIITEHHAAVYWMGEGAPKDFERTTIMQSVAAKLKRNISLAVVETTLLLESACRYARLEPDRRGYGLEQLLRRSRQLYAGLAMLHDNQEQERVRALTGITGILEYPQTSYHHVLAGDIAVAPSHFVEYGESEQRKLKFAPAPDRTTTLDSPTKRCPAQRPNLAGSGSPPLNDRLWDLLIEAYSRCGRFD